MLDFVSSCVVHVEVANTQMKHCATTSILSSNYYESNWGGMCVWVGGGWGERGGNKIGGQKNSLPISVGIEKLK